MKRHVKIYLKEKRDTTADTIMCEIQSTGCETVAVDIHHIEPRGMGGSKSKDVNENLIAGCRFCHDLAEAGGVSKDKLKQIAQRRINANLSD